MSLLFSVGPTQSYAVMKGQKIRKKGIVQTMYVAKVYPAKNNETYITVIFDVSQRFYKIAKDANPKYLELLKESEKNHTPLSIRRDKEESVIITEVKKPK